MILMGIDPGPDKSGVAAIKDGRLVDAGHIDNHQLLIVCREAAHKTETLVAVERVVAYGRVVGQSTIDTAYWSGRFAEAARTDNLISFPDVKLQLCGLQQVKNSQVRQATLDLFPATGGGSCPQKGTKSRQGPLYGIKGDHAWSALAVAVAWAEKSGRLKECGLDARDDSV